MYRSLLVALSLPLVVTGRLLAAELFIPNADSILEKLRDEHPRLLATSADFERLKDRCNKNDKAHQWLLRLEAKAEALLSTPPLKYQIPDGKRLLAVSRAAKDRVLLLGLVYRLKGDERFAERLWQELDTVTQFKNWNPSHFLDTAEMTFAVAMGYDWLYDAWTPPRRRQLREAIVRMGLQQSLPIYKKRSGWSRAVHNWNQVCNGGMAVGALAIADEEPALAREILHDALTSLPLAMHEFRPDGGWGEGPGYWRYATEYNVYLLAALRTALGNDFGLSKMPGFSETGDFPIYFTGPTGQTFNYADAHSGWHGAPQLSWLATSFNRPAWAAHQEQHASKSASPLDLLWGADWIERLGEPNRIPLDRHFEGVSVVFLRGAWNDPLTTFVGFKGGDNRVNHGHLDLGSFVLDALGERWFVDLGPDNYNLPGYFGSRRWDYYRCRAEGHNTLVISSHSNNTRGAGSTAADQDPRAIAPIIKFDSQPERAFAIANLTAPYAGATDRVYRGVVLINRRHVLVQDEIAADKPYEAWWFAHTGADISLDPTNRMAILKQNHKTLYARLLEPEGASFQVMDAAPLAISPHVDGQANQSEGSHSVRKLAIHLAGQTNSRIAVLISPALDAEITVRPIERW